MRILKLIIAGALLAHTAASVAQQVESKAERSLKWYKDAKFGMFIHFDVRGDKDTWSPGNLDTDAWVRIARQGGMK